jgi:predicted dehydrogenase
MAKKINVAISSFGMSGLVFHGPLLKVNSNFNVSKIFERTKELSKTMFPDATIVRSFDDITNDPDIDLVVVNTPDALHYEYTKKVLEAGKHAVVEKPFVQDIEQGEELIQLAKEKGLILTVFQNRRWDGDFMTAKKVIDDGLLGRLVEYEAHFDRYRNFIQPNTWKEDPDAGAGLTFNLGSHMIDQALVLFGKPNAVEADIRTVRTNGKVDDFYDIDLYYDDVKVKCKSSYLVREEGPRFILHGTNGSFLKWGIDPQEEMLKKGVLPNESNWGEENKEDWGKLNTEISGLHVEGNVETIPGDYKIFYGNLYEVLAHGKPQLVNLEDSLLVVKIIKAAFESSKTASRIGL